MQPNTLFAVFLAPAVVLHLAVLASLPRVGTTQKKERPETVVEVTMEDLPEPVIEEMPPPPPPPAAAPQPEPEPEPEPGPEPEPEEESEPEPPRPEEVIEVPALPPVPAPRIASAGALGGVIGGVEGGVIGGKVAPPPPPPEPVEPPKPALPSEIKVGAAVQESRLLFRKNPEYPRQAKKMRIQGTVKLRARIDQRGQVAQIQLIDGHPMLAPAAMEAVKAWKYRPTMLAGKPVTVVTEIHVKFALR